MTDKQTEDTLTLSAKVNRLFDAFRARHEPEQTEEAVAQSVSHLLGRTVVASEIAALRRGGNGEVAPDLLGGLVRHFGVPHAYLATSGSRADSLDKQLQLLVAARDAGVERLALRGMDLEDALHPTLSLLQDIAATEDL